MKIYDNLSMHAGEPAGTSLQRMNISMDKYKTSELGKALKKVFRGEFTIDDSVKIAENEIKELLVNSRKADFLQKVKQDIYNEALKNGNVIFYNKQPRE